MLHRNIHTLQERCSKNRRADHCISQGFKPNFKTSAEKKSFIMWQNTTSFKRVSVGSLFTTAKNAESNKYQQSPCHIPGLVPRQKLCECKCIGKKNHRPSSAVSKDTKTTQGSQGNLKTQQSLSRPCLAIQTRGLHTLSH